MKDIDQFIIFLKEKGFIYHGSEIYGGLANTWDYGPIGSLLKVNLKKMWRKEFIFKQVNNFAFDSSIFLNTKVWNASGHLEKFNDPMIDCKSCKNRFRADDLIEDKLKISSSLFSIEEMTKLIHEKILCSKCKQSNWTEVREFKLMFETSNSKTKENNIYLRPETAQGIFINFNNFKEGMFGKLPFGIGQVGKAFRNEITPGNFIFRTKEFEQLELEFFCLETEETFWFEHYQNLTLAFLKKLNISEKDISLLDVPKAELAHYSKKTLDIEFLFPFGKGELLGIANRSNFDLKNHSLNSGINLDYLLDDQKIIPSIIETSIGVERLLFAILWTAWNNLNPETNFLPLPYDLAAYKVAILPLTKFENEITLKIKEQLKSSKIIENFLYLEKGNIGKRYKRIAELGIPFSLTIDKETINDQSITIRDSQTKLQTRILISDLDRYFFENIIYG